MPLRSDMATAQPRRTIAATWGEFAASARPLGVRTTTSRLGLSDAPWFPGGPIPAREFSAPAQLPFGSLRALARRVAAAPRLHFRTTRTGSARCVARRRAPSCAGLARLPPKQAVAEGRQP